MLSGGVDSSAIVESMTRQLGDRPRTFAFGRDGDDDEIIRARAAAKLFGTKHTEIYFDPAMHHSGFVELISRYGEPIALLPLVHTLELCRAIRADGLKVVLSGHGADELFFGYSAHVGQAFISQVEPFVGGPLRVLARGMSVALASHDGLAHAATVLGAPFGMRRAALYANSAKVTWPKFLRPEARPNVEHLLARWMESIPGASGASAYIDEAMVVALLSENAPSVTIAADLPAMAVGVETRCPFLDQKVIDLAYRIDFRKKVGSPRDRLRMKRILKEALRRRLPDSILSAPKVGFGFNVQEADVLAGPWRADVESALAEADDLGGVLNLKSIRELPRALNAPAGRANAQMLLKIYGLLLARDKFAAVPSKFAA